MPVNDSMTGSNCHKPSQFLFWLDRVKPTKLNLVGLNLKFNFKLNFIELEAGSTSFNQYQPVVDKKSSIVFTVLMIIKIVCMRADEDNEIQNA